MRFLKSCLSRSRQELVSVPVSRLLLVCILHWNVFYHFSKHNFTLQLLVTTMAILVLESSAPRKSQQLFVVQSSWPSFPSFPSVEDIGVTRSVSPILSLARWLASAVQYWCVWFPDLVVLVSSQLPFPRSCWWWPVSRIATPLLVVAPELLATSVRIIIHSLTP